jgi:hypothetical protein
MTTTVINETGWDQLLREYIMPGIESTIQKIINEEITRAEETVRGRLREAVAGIAVRLARQFDIQKFGHELRITFVEEDLRKQTGG